MDFALYSGGFFNADDKKQMMRIRHLTPEQLANATFQFHDQRLPELVFRYRARNYPHTLNAVEHETWRAFCRDRLTQQKAGVTLTDYLTRLQSLKAQANNDEMIETLTAYAVELAARLD